MCISTGENIYMSTVVFHTFEEGRKKEKRKLVLNVMTSSNPSEKTVILAR